MKVQDSTPKSQDYKTLPQSQEYKVKNVDFSPKSQESQGKSHEFQQNKHGMQNSSMYKAQTRNIQNKSSQGVALSSAPNNSVLRDRVVSNHRVTSPPVKLLESQRVSSPPIKMSDQRQVLEYSKMDTKPEHCNLGPVDPSNVSLGLSSNHFVHQYPERDTPSDSQNGGPAWEGGLLFMPEKYANVINSSYLPLSISSFPSHQLPSSHISKPGNAQERAVDADDHKELAYTSTQPNPNVPKSKNVSRLSPLGSDCNGDEKFYEYPPEKDGAGAEVMVNGSDLKKLAEVTSKMALTVLPDDVDSFNELNKQHLNNQVGHMRNHPTGRVTPESTDCGSLSKSSSDGDHMINRKRPPTKLKSKRRNIFSFPQHLSSDELRIIQVRNCIFSMCLALCSPLFFIPFIH